MRSRNNSAAGEMVNKLRGINASNTLRTVPGTQLALTSVFGYHYIFMTTLSQPFLAPSEEEESRKVSGVWSRRQGTAVVSGWQLPRPSLTYRDRSL